MSFIAWMYIYTRYLKLIYKDTWVPKKLMRTLRIIKRPNKTGFTILIPEDVSFVELDIGLKANRDTCRSPNLKGDKFK